STAATIDLVDVCPLDPNSTLTAWCVALTGQSPLNSLSSAKNMAPHLPQSFQPNLKWSNAPN
ncbi:hypothetical protein J7E99_20970, partial [Streptomyces sp. ISL-44]|uniref:hypothetical protein n=1 Tax=Streptomyces sp. ISL-44 TaxID=2819184 RepID=UPI001BE7EE13